MQSFECICCFSIGLLVETDGDLVAENSKYLTADVLLRLVSERHPGKNLVAYTNSNLPILPSFYVDGVRHGGAPPVYMQVAGPRQTYLPTIQQQEHQYQQPTQTIAPAIVSPPSVSKRKRSIDQTKNFHEIKLIDE
jgi:hypothetical protein